ncbi:Male sterility NAD-binding [Penicillium manginii]|uniref:Male sterility NAD-binding n=1 Tax=Penicillium manginii TaxID=203109 RepID=UPI0025494F29|nr:Male sterility NAD-binding [Penicillium manginii]KAJ5744672.1 Male sterility NAD-binding [Penicillium manginii]
MSESTPQIELKPKAFVFGSQDLSFNAVSFKNLHSQLHSQQWAVDILASLPDLWDKLSNSGLRVQQSDSRHLLDNLNSWIASGKAPEAAFPLPNILLSPLVVICQLIDYLDFIQSGIPGLRDEDDFSKTFPEDMETLGLCIGTLSAFAVACSSNMADIQANGGVAIRLAMLIGAIVDAEEDSREPERKSMSFSASSGGSESGESFTFALDSFTDAYISVIVDQKRVTFTTSRETGPTFVEQMKKDGAHVTSIALSGRFHWKNHEKPVASLMSLCDRYPDLQFPEIPNMILASRSSGDGKYVTSGKLHEIALLAILLEQSQWYETCRLAYYSKFIPENAAVVCFGSERCMPPTISRKLGSRLIYAHEINIASSQIPGSLLGRTQTVELADLPDERIAVIGMACQLPGAGDHEAFREILKRGQSQHREVPDDRFGMETAWRDIGKHKWYGNFIDNHDTFDHKFFKKSPREISSTDPQHRLMLQVAYQAVEQSGYFGNDATNQPIGCFMGVGNVDYEENIVCYPANAYSATGNLKSFLAGKISHHFGWTGPSLTLDTACSSSSVAIHQACRSIINGECSGALAGGVNIITSPNWYHNLDGASFLSPTGQCKPFDSNADGYCRGEGVGAVFLKRLPSAIADGDQVLGVIASTKVYQNQNCTAITVPNATSLSQLFTDVVRQARLEPKQISLVEAHGTGTPVGDPAEYDGIRSIFGGSIRSDILSLGSAKGFIGHTECASGVASLVKTLIMINEGFIPPQASFSNINPALNTKAEDRIEVSTQLRNWETPFKAALINNYGASGSNASMIVTQAPKAADDPSTILPEGGYPFWITAFDQQSLLNYAKRLRRYVQGVQEKESNLSLANLSFQVSRQSNRRLPHALIFNVSTKEELHKVLESFESGSQSIHHVQVQDPKPVILCFGGQISTYVGLDQEVYKGNAILREYLDQCDATILSLGLESIFPAIFQRTPISDIVQLQTVLFAMQYACAKAWLSSGLRVASVVGHSFGELTALCISNAVSLKDAVRMISGRSRLIQDRWGSEKGSMIAIEADLPDVEALLAKVNSQEGSEAHLSIACYNSSRSFTLAGSVKQVDYAENLLRSDSNFSGGRAKRLNVTNAFHSALVDALVDDLENLGHTIEFKEPTIKLERATEYESTNPLNATYLSEHMRKPVFFAHAVRRLSERFPAAVWLEAGSNSTITTMASRALGTSNSHFQPVNITSDSSFRFLSDATINLWKNGQNVTFWAHHRIQTPAYTPVLLPPYQFEKSKHWMDLRVPPKLEDSGHREEQLVAIEAPKGLTTFVGYQDASRRSVRFGVNVTSDKYIRLLSGHIMANEAAVCPGMFQVEIVLDALTSLRPDFQNHSFIPELYGLRHYHPLVKDESRAVWIEADSSDAEGLIWSWKLTATDAKGTGSVTHTSGTIIFQPADGVQVKTELERLTRLIGRKRCLQLLDSNLADDVLQGRNIYRAFSEVIDYKEVYRHVTKIAGRDNESAGRVVKPYANEGCLDTVLTDCFCQVAGIFVNLMTTQADLSERGIFICDGIDRWLRAPEAISNDNPSDVYEIFALHHPESESKYLSDVFAFNARDGSLVEVALGISYQKVPISGIRKVLSKNMPAGLQPQVLPSSVSKVNVPPANFLPVAPPPLLNGSAAKVTATSTPKKLPKTPSVDITGIMRDIICNLSGLEPEEIKDDSDLVEIGIDSLMSMELGREIDLAFKTTIDVNQLIDVTDFRSLVETLGRIMGLDDTDGDSGFVEDDRNDEAVTNGNGHHSIAPNGNGSSSPGPQGLSLPESTVLECFRIAKEATDDFMVNGQLGTYYTEVMPRSTKLCVAHIVNAFERLGCPIRNAVAGQKLERVPYLPKHERFMNLIHGLLEEDGLIEISGSDIVRTSMPVATKSVNDMLEELLRDEPVHAAEHKLTGMIGPKFADCLIGKEDGLQMIFGSPEGREIVTDVYAKSPINSVWIQQAEFFLEHLIQRLPMTGEPLRILEMGAGTGGTTVKMISLLERLGVPVEYTMTDLSSSLVAAARKRFKKHPFMKFKVVNIESPPDADLLHSQHIILATNCVHATRNLEISTRNIHDILRPDGFLLLLEMTEQVPWVDFIFGLLEGWWLFEDGRQHALQPPAHWRKILTSVGYGAVDWTDGARPETNLQRLIIALASGSRYDPASQSLQPSVTSSLTDTAGRQEIIDSYIHEYTKEFHSLPVSNLQVPVLPSPAGHCVLVTGATGSLGSHVVAYLARLPNVHKVVCLNRWSTIPATVRQVESFKLRGIALDEKSRSKLEILEVDTSKPSFGLSAETYQKLVSTATHIVHNAWPMSLTRSIRGYESQFSVMRNLINLAREVVSRRPAPFKFSFQFISSIGIVSYHPIRYGVIRAPEETMSADSVLPVGYAEAKLVCERMLDETLHRYPSRFRPMAVRIAQITGSESNGYWNPVEHFAFVVKSSQFLKAFPDLDGTLSWCPVDDVSATLGELLISDTKPYPIYHIENPSRQRWQDMVKALTELLDIPQEGIIPFDQWLERVRNSSASINENPAKQLVDFFSQHFIRISCGGLILDTSKTKRHSATLRERGRVELNSIVKYISAWKTIGFLE